ncbi:abnormal spindle-like microcephaly-associated protein homolog isoform X1 [Zingiber officinale]|uniref:abnormal spindle-like microcephaly-associated protein homolog isoform X1 n=1 Tax=Zingiber officinale TaxID=94328 RepID=UPI001C4B9B73|nr:abnormal spindle-like microcephaly-associated protein homolog isoform X1 [Zingiber officinale]
MDRRRRPDRDPTSPPPPLASTPSHFLRDCSNYKTPKSLHLNPNPRPPCTPLPAFYTASKTTPYSFASVSSRRRGTPGAATARRRVKTLELEQSRSSRKNQDRRERALKSFSSSISAWLNFLFRSPSYCGCQVPLWSRDRQGGVVSNGKRESFDGDDVRGFGAGGRWRSPKRQRDCSWRGTSGDDVERKASVMVSSLKSSLKEVCSLEDLMERMELYMSQKSCKEVLIMMSQVCKSIDEGRLKMKASCPLVTDLRLKENAIRTLMSYNPTWLRVGLHIIFGGDSFLSNEEGKSDQEFLFLKMVIETQFFSQVELARSFAYNKLVEGLYKPGYHEALGSVILKRFLLLVVSLDKAKSECTLPTKYGIDSIDGGSPLLFILHSHLKSSQQVINEFLSEIMHGEGNLLAHLLTLGYKVNHQQNPISEYEFNMKDLFEEIQDGVLLSRAIQLLRNDASILSKLMVPPNTSKKKLQNCINVVKYLKQAGVSMCDADGTQILAEDIANGDKELTLCVLWNLFVSLQVPLLIDKASLVNEVIKLKKHHKDDSDYSSKAIMGLLFEWIQVVCEGYDIEVGGLSSLVDGKALCCLILHYSDAEDNGLLSSKENQDVHIKFCRRFEIGRTAGQNLVLVQRITKIIGNFPEVLQLSDLLDDETYFDKRSIIILLVFLASLFTSRKDLDTGKMYNLMKWNWNIDSTLCVTPLGTLFDNSLSTKSKLRRINIAKVSSPLKNKCLDTYDNGEWAAKVIQAYFRRIIERKKFLELKKATCILQSSIRAWQTVVLGRKNSVVQTGCSESLLFPGQYNRHKKLMVERHKFVHIKKSVQLIQSAVRAWIMQRHQRTKAPSGITTLSLNRQALSAELDILQLQTMSAIKIQNAWRGFKRQVLSARFHILQERTMAANKIQNAWRGFKRQTLSAELGILQQQTIAAIKIQSAWREFKRQALSVELDILHQQTMAATKIQNAWRGFILRRHLLVKRCSTIKIQSHWRAWRIRMNFYRMRKSVIKIQASIRCMLCMKQLNCCRLATTVIQQFVRGHLARNKLLGASSLRYRRSYALPNVPISGTIKHRELKIVKFAVLTIQRWWKQILLERRQLRAVIFIQSFIRRWHAKKASNELCHSIFIIQRWWKDILFHESRRRSTVIIQAHVRGWIIRKTTSRTKYFIVLIQSYWKGYLARKRLKQQIFDLRCELNTGSAHVKGCVQPINRLVAALPELFACRTISNLRHICAMLSNATQHSQGNCEALVAAGAIDILLKQIGALNRGFPDQEVLKHVLSILRNIVKHPRLLRAFVDTSRSAEIIFQEVLRNKNEGYFIACDLLKCLCSTPQGCETIRNLPGYIRRLKVLAHDLERKSELQKRNAAQAGRKDEAVRRHGDAVNLLQLILDNHDP